MFLLYIFLTFTVTKIMNIIDELNQTVYSRIPPTPSYTPQGIYLIKNTK